jgi:uncharacterized protein (DUF488 family)
LLAALGEARIELLIDVRRFPTSRRNPQFNREALAASLRDAGIDYRHVEALGGRREPHPDSPNTALTNAGSRGYADYMATPSFTAALAGVPEAAESRRVAIMCAESLPWRCHRSLIADSLVARGIEVVHLIGTTQRTHTLSPFARVEDGRVTYPALL